MRQANRGVKRVPYSQAIQGAMIREYDFISPYVEDLQNIIDLESIRAAGLRIGVDPLGGASVAYWEPIAQKYGLKIDLVNPVVDPTFSFMSVDKDGKIRMDCSSPYAMAGLIQLKDRYDIAFGNDADCDRHGIVCPGAGLMNPNHYLSVAVWYLFQNRPHWPGRAAVGKTLVSSSLIDRVAADLKPTAGRGAGRFQMVCGGIEKRGLRHRAGGKRRGFLSAERRDRLDHGQRRDHHGSAGRRDYGPHRERPGGFVSGTDRAIWTADL